MFHFYFCGKMTSILFDGTCMSKFLCCILSLKLKKVYVIDMHKKLVITQSLF